MAQVGLKLRIDSTKKNVFLTRIRKFLLDPRNLKTYIASLPENEKGIFQKMLAKKGVCVYRDLLDTGYQKRYDHSKADYINNLLSISGVVFTAVPNPNKYNNLLMIPRDIAYIIKNKFKPDHRTLKELDTVSVFGVEKSPPIILDNSNFLLRDLVIFTSFINRNTVRQLSNNGIGRNDLKKIIPYLSAHKTVKYVSFLALFCILKKFIIGVGDFWSVSSTFVKWLENSHQCYADLYRFWLETTEWNEEFVDGDTIHAESYPSSLVNITELRKLVLQNLENIPHNRWIRFSAFVESVLPQIEISIPKRGSQLILDKFNRSNHFILESIIGETMHWLGLIALGLHTMRDHDRLGNRDSETYLVNGRRIKAKTGKDRDISFYFKLTDLGRHILKREYLDPEKILEPQEEGEIDAMAYEIKQFTVQPNLEVITPPDLNLRSFYHLNEFADIKSIDVMSTLAITKESLREGMDKGLRGEDILKFLTDSCRQKLPETVRHLIAECSEKHGEVNMGFAGGYIRVDDPILLEELRSHKRLNEAIKDVIDNKLILLNADVNIKKLTKELQKIGFMPHLESEQIHVTSEGKYHLSLTKEDLYYLMAILKFVLVLEEDLGSSVTEDKVTPLLERLKPNSKSYYNLNFFAETISKGFEKKYQNALNKKVAAITSKYKKQLSQLMSSTVSRLPSKYSFSGPNPATKPKDIHAMVDFAAENDLQVEITYLKGNKSKVVETVEPESLDGDIVYAYSEAKDTFGVYRVDRIVRSRLV
jgi:hypothetical protein